MSRHCFISSAGILKMPFDNSSKKQTVMSKSKTVYNYIASLFYTLLNTAF